MLHRAKSPMARKRQFSAANLCLRNKHLVRAAGSNQGLQRNTTQRMPMRHERKKNLRSDTHQNMISAQWALRLCLTRRAARSIRLGSARPPLWTRMSSIRKQITKRTCLMRLRCQGSFSDARKSRREIAPTLRDENRHQVCLLWGPIRQLEPSHEMGPRS